MTPRTHAFQGRLSLYFPVRHTHDSPTPAQRRRNARVAGRSGRRNGSGGRTLGQGHGRRVLLTGRIRPLHLDVVSRAVRVHHRAEVVGRGDRVAVDCGDRVAGRETGGLRRAPRRDAGDLHTVAEWSRRRCCPSCRCPSCRCPSCRRGPCRRSSSCRTGRCRRSHRTDRHHRSPRTDPSCRTGRCRRSHRTGRCRRNLHPCSAVRSCPRSRLRGSHVGPMCTVALGRRSDLLGDVERLVDRDREALGRRRSRGSRTAAAGRRRRVHPDDLAVGVHERAAGVAGLDRRVGLDGAGERLGVRRRSRRLR